MKKILKILLVIVIGVSFLFSNNIVQAKSKELNYSSKKVKKVARINNALKLMRYFEGGAGGMKVNYNKTIVAYNKRWGCKVDHYLVKEKKISSMKKLNRVLKKTFSKKIRKRLWKRSLFFSVDNKLYVADAGIGDNPFYKCTKYRIVKKTLKKRVIRATSYFYDLNTNKVDYSKTTVRKFVQKKVNGKWKYTRIELPFYER